MDLYRSQVPKPDSAINKRHLTPISQAMSLSDSQTVKTGVIGTVVGGLVLAALAELWPPAKTFFLWAFDSVKSFGSYLRDDYGTPRWVLTLLVIFALVTVTRFVVSLFPKFAPDHSKFVEMTYCGAKWQWGWASGQISNIWCLCPSCQAELVYDDSSNHNRYTNEKAHTKFICENCNGQVVAEVDGGDKEYAVSAVKREVRRRVRTGEYKGSLPSEA